MPRAVRTHLPYRDDEETPDEEKPNPKALTKEEFGRRVYNLMLKRGWNQSELARRSGLKRDAVSTYVRGKTFPTPQSLKKLAKAFDMPAEDLLPNVIKTAVEAERAPALAIHASSIDPSVVWLQVNQNVPVSVALKVAEVLESARVESEGKTDDEADDAG